MLKFIKSRDYIVFMIIIKKELSKNIFVLEFESQLDITSTFLRFQEYYESPKFSGKIFTLNEYKKWYIKEKGSFTYYTDWSGFNIPSYVLKPFFEGKFNPLSKKEKQLLNLFKDIKNKYYIIGIHKGMNKKKIKYLLRHEIAHAMFYTDSNYRLEVLHILKKYDVSKIKDKLSSMGGYARSVLDDEVHAYSLDFFIPLKIFSNIFLSLRIRRIFSKYIKSKGIKL